MLLSSEERYEKVLEMIPDECMQSELLSIILSLTAFWVSVISILFDMAIGVCSYYF